MKNPEILIFDEATSSLDHSSEEMIRQAIDEISRDKTIIVISHRLSWMNGMDRVLMIENGALIEETKKTDPAHVHKALNT